MMITEKMPKKKVTSVDESRAIFQQLIFQGDVRCFNCGMAPIAI